MSPARVFTTAAAVLLLSVLCIGGMTATSAQSSAPVYGPLEYPDNINPLTGLAVSDPAVLNRRPMIVKISNYPPLVRPQSGLMSADIVWEHLLSGGVTRFSAVFLGNDVEQVGPIRSLRLVDFELVRIYRALSIYSGMAQGTRDVLSTDGVMSRRIIGGIDPCPALCRFPREGVALEHTLYGNTAALRELAVERDRDVAVEPVYGMAFSADAGPAGVPITAARINWAETTVQWAYDQAAGRWLRMQDGEPHMDALTSRQISAANIVILEDVHTVQPLVRDGYWGPGDFAFSVNLVGSGRIYLLRDGQYFTGQWQRATRTDPMTYVDANGNPLRFAPGNTFIGLVPRWVDGYSLEFDLTSAPTVQVGGTTGINMRLGPDDDYIALDVAYPGDTFAVIGRNNNGSWLQLRTMDNAIVWMPSTLFSLLPADVERLPAVRPSNER